MKREQLQSWNILSFNPKKTDVDKCIDLINTLGDMVDQKEEAKMEKFIETMPTMIQTHLIICKDWADVKDKAKSLEHIIWKYDLPTLAMPLVTTGASICICFSRPVDEILRVVQDQKFDIPSVILWHPVLGMLGFKFMLEMQIPCFLIYPRLFDLCQKVDALVLHVVVLYIESTWHDETRT